MIKKIMSIILVFTFMFSISGCGIFKSDKEVEVFFVDPSTKQLASEKREIKGETKQEILDNVLDALISGPKNQNYVKSIASDLTVNSVTLEDKRVYVDVSSDYKDLSINERLYFRGAIVLTFTGIDGVDEVGFTSDGAELLRSDGTPIGILKRDSFVMGDIVLSPTKVNTETITLYFSDNNAINLVLEERKIQVNPNQPIEKFIIENLILGPENADNLPTIPKDTKLRSVETREGIAYVDLSADFITKMSGGSSSEQMAIYSIVQSLTALENVDKVQFLIDGEKEQNAAGHFDLTTPIGPMTSSNE